MRKIIIGLAGCSLMLSGCAAGRINSGLNFSMQAAAPASTGPGKIGKTFGDVPLIGASDVPLRQMQVDMVTNLSSLLARDGLQIIAQSTKPSKANRDSSKVIDLTGLSNRQALDKLLGAVSAADHPAKVRNEVVAQLVAASNANCAVYLQALRANQVQSRLVSDLFASGFGVAGGLARSARTASRMSSLAGLSVSVGASLDRNIFAQQGAELVAQSIVELRLEQRTQLESQMKLGPDVWPMGLALADVFSYHSDCSMLRGFSRMRKVIEGREDTIQALRKAAVAVAQKGGSAEQVVAVMSGADPRIEPASAPTIQVGRDDIDRNGTLGIDCINDVFKQFKDNPTKVTFSTTASDTAVTPAASCTKAGPWSKPYRELGLTLLSSLATEDALKEAQKGRDVKPDPKSQTHPDDKLEALIVKITNAYALKAKVKADSQYVTRITAYTALDQIHGATTQTPEAVASLVMTFGGSETPDDPVLAAGLGAATAGQKAAEASPETITGITVAQWALGAMRSAYVEASKPPAK